MVLIEHDKYCVINYPSPDFSHLITCLGFIPYFFPKLETTAVTCSSHNPFNIDYDLSQYTNEVRPEKQQRWLPNLYRIGSQCSRRSTGAILSIDGIDADNACESENTAVVMYCFQT